MRRLLIIFCLIKLGNTATAQETYDATLINKSLLPYASSIVRNKEETIEVKSLENTIYHIKAAITVLNKNGNDQAHIFIWHDKSITIKYAKGVIYDERGKKINKFSESDFDDVSAANNFSLFEDSRISHFMPSVVNYPYTIEYEYEVRMKQSLNFPNWRPNRSTGVAIEKSSYTFICRPDFNIHYKETNLSAKATISNTANVNTYSWSIRNIKAIQDEPYSPNVYAYAISVKIAPEKFSYQGIDGSFTNWNELGKWFYDKLLTNRDQLPEQTKSYIKELTKDIPDPKQKAKKIYEYMQQKTHYISIQVGIGGYQPFKAGDVDKLNYGDCKALVNYTQALLKVADIPSYYCMVEAGGNKSSMLTDFTSMDQGNHVILCIPFKNDTTWLECTSQKIPFGFLGDFTDDRIVIACTPEGGKLMHTPKYSAYINQEQRNGNFTLNEKGELSGDMETRFKGIQYETREPLIYTSKTEQVKALVNIYPINNMEIETINFKQDKTTLPVITENIKLSARDYASASANKLYFQVNSVNRAGHAPREVSNRQTNLYINEGFTDDDEINYTIPAGYHLEKIPLNVTISKPFGNYSASVSLKGDKLVYSRKLQVIDGTYDKSTYQDFVEFYQRAVDADNYSITLVKAKVN